MTESGNKQRKDSRIQLGRLGEETACRFLRDAGYRIVERNWRCRSGEIDLIAEHEGRLVFVEVRSRTAGGRFGTAAESVDRRKQMQIRETAQVYLKSRMEAGASIQFDVVTVEVSRGDGSVVACSHYPRAF
ncbi:YraN family protein [Paenibacillus arenilitoris]|uniref:UPF0102 protein IDH41_19405 n=1 Tax=Paenibacillus arenilitoris TaxID=2772299 RepID=A0A927H779_9BACL|nr:YraN family protein [Paenibacillus arenilitoris]MBD2870755.1 YraN family protein [Paenibacillus arenilitoris]